MEINKNHFIINSVNCGYKPSFIKDKTSTERNPQTDETASNPFDKSQDWGTILGKSDINYRKNNISTEEFRNLLKENEDFWQIPPDAVDDETAIILSKHIKNISDIKYSPADTLSKILIDEARNADAYYLKHSYLKKAIKLLPNGQYNNGEYSEKLREEILKISLDTTNDPISDYTMSLIFDLEDSENKNNPGFAEYKKAGLMNYYVYTKIKAASSKEELKMMNQYFATDVAKEKFIYNKLFEVAAKEINPKEKAYLNSIAFHNMQIHPHIEINGEKFTRLLKLAHTPGVEEQAQRRLSDMFDSYFPELKNSSISNKSKMLLLAEATSFKQGAGCVDPKEYVAYDKIYDITKVIKKDKNNLSEKDIQELKNVAYAIAQKHGKRYVDALDLHFETGMSYDIYRKKDDKILNLENHRNGEFYNDEDNKIAYEYIECGDSSLTGGAFGINLALRTDSVGNDKFIKREIEGLDRLTTDKKSALDDDYTVLRAMDGSTWQEYINEYLKEGNIVLDKGYVSTTPQMGTYSNMFGGRPGESYVMRIKLPKGTRGANFKKCHQAWYGGNEEFLLPRNAKFKITDVDNDAKVIEAEYIVPDYRD